MKNITVDDFRKVFHDRLPGIQGARGRFAVAVPVVDIDGEAHLLYELRSEKIDRQPSEVCFPGGEIEPGETELEAALRETWEEIGIEPGQIEVISQLDVFHPPQGIVLYPFLVSIRREALDNMKINENEVAECFTVPVSFLLGKPYEYRHSVDYKLGEDFRYDKVGLPDGHYNFRQIEHRIISWEYRGRYIWGMTALITEWTLRIMELAGYAERSF